MVQLTEFQRKKLLASSTKGQCCNLRLKHCQLSGGSLEGLTKVQQNKIRRCNEKGMGCELKFSKTQLKKGMKGDGVYYDPLAFRNKMSGILNDVRVRQGKEPVKKDPLVQALNKALSRVKAKQGRGVEGGLLLGLAPIMKKNTRRALKKGNGIDDILNKYDV